MCLAHKAGNIAESEYTLHVKLKDMARVEKPADKEKAQASYWPLLWTCKL
nr:unnamed protein product [Callosobruchus analis]